MIGYNERKIAWIPAQDSQPEVNQEVTSENPNCPLIFKSQDHKNLKKHVTLKNYFNYRILNRHGN